MLSTGNISQLNRALEASFGNIKKDMQELRVSINAQTEHFAAIRKELESAKTNTATNDKLNVLKIKLGEVNEDVKKVWDIEKQVKGMTNTVNKRSLLDRLDELQDKVVAMEVKMQQKVSDLQKNSATELQVKTVVGHISSELNKLSQGINKADNSIAELRQRNYNKEFQKIANEITATNKDIVGVRKVLQNYVDKDEVKGLVTEVTKDFDSLKKDVATLYKRDAAFVRESEVKNVLKSVNKEFDGIAQEISSLKKQNKEFVSVNQIKGLINDISDEFADIKENVSNLEKRDIASARKDIDDLRKQFGGLQKDAKKITEVQKESKKELATIKKQKDTPELYGASVVLKQQAPAKAMPQIPMRKTKAVSTLAITAAFLLLIGSIVTYFMGSYTYTDSLAIGAVVTFIVGMCLKLLVALKSN